MLCPFFWGPLASVLQTEDSILISGTEQSLRKDSRLTSHNFLMMLTTVVVVAPTGVGAAAIYPTCKAAIRAWSCAAVNTPPVILVFNPSLASPPVPTSVPVQLVLYE